MFAFSLEITKASALSIKTISPHNVITISEDKPYIA